jgi:formiminotetrahydrofolate cyclodeaminase
MNVRINLASLGTSKEGKTMLKQLRALEKTARDLDQRVRTQIETRGGFSLE